MIIVLAVLLTIVLLVALTVSRVAVVVDVEKNMLLTNLDKESKTSSVATGDVSRNRKVTHTTAMPR